MMRFHRIMIERCDGGAAGSSFLTTTCRNIGPCHALPAWIREPKHADIDGLFCRRGNCDRGGHCRSWRWLSGCEHYQPAYAGDLQAGTQDVGGTDQCLERTSGAGAAWGWDEFPAPGPPGRNPAHAA